MTKATGPGRLQTIVAVFAALSIILTACSSAKSSSGAATTSTSDASLIHVSDFLAASPTEQEAIANQFLALNGMPVTPTNAQAFISAVKGSVDSGQFNASDYLGTVANALLTECYDTGTGLFVEAGGSCQRTPATPTAPSTTTAPTAPPTTPSETMTTINPTITNPTSGIEFRSPTGNIHCEIDYGPPEPNKGTFCFSFVPPQSATLSVVGTYSTCIGATCLANPGVGEMVLPYGQQISLGPFLCASSTGGMTCTSNGQGFKISASGIVKAP
jgi:hypothetical protein